MDEVVFALPSRIGRSWERLSLDSQLKHELLNVLVCDVSIEGLRHPLMSALDRTAQSFADVVQGKREQVLLPEFA